jgi:hypothetical protein
MVDAATELRNLTAAKFDVTGKLEQRLPPQIRHA